MIKHIPGGPTCCILGMLMMIWSGTFCQVNFNPDSLKQIIGSSAPEIEKDRSMKKLAEGYLNSDPEQSLQYNEMLAAKARASGDIEMMAELLWLKGRAYLSLEMYDSSIVYCDSGLAVAGSIGLVGRMAEINIIKGTALYYGKGPEAGLSAYKESHRLFAEQGDSAGLAKSLNGQGVMFKKMAQYDSAVNCYINLITIAEKKSYENTLGMGYLNLGILFQDLKEFDKASRYLNLSIPINEKYRTDLVALAHMNIGLINYEQGILDTALIELRVALGIYATRNERRNKADVYNNIGNVFYKSKQLDSAYIYFNYAKDLYGQLAYWYSYAQVYNNLGTVYIDWGKYDRALEILDSSLYYANKAGNAELVSKVYSNLYSVYFKKSDYKKALENYLVHDSLEEIQYTLAKEKLMADLEMKYQNQKKQAHILELEKNNLQKDLDLQVRTRQSNAYLFTGIAIISLISFAFLYFRQRTIKDRIITEHRIRQLEEEKKLMAAKLLVEGQEEERKRIARELHDGLGVLLSATKMQFSSIKDTSPENRPLIERATQLLEQATGDVRKISHNMMPGLLTKLGLYEAVEDLIDNLNDSGNINAVCQIDENLVRLPENKEIMLYRIFQEMVNNTLKHAGAKNIKVQVRALEKYLEILYSDDGKGFDVNTMLESQSIGLKSIQSRVNFLNGKIDIQSSPGNGASYLIQVPA
jgi:two-component system, NarL family, sensor kinase